MILQDAYDLDRGLIGIDLELLVRNDLAKKFEVFADKFNFEVDFDGSVTFAKNTLEVLYNSHEIRSYRPMLASKLIPRLAQILAWLKHVDNEYVDALDKFGLSVHKTLDRRIKLPRGKVPTNLSAGLHLHFDADMWFDDIIHVSRFIKLVSATQDEIKARVVPGRYGMGKASREFMPAPGRTFAPFPKDADASVIANIANDLEYRDQVTHSNRGRVSPPDALRYSGLNPERYSAVNLSPTADRGDVEIRFMHSTLNIDTITMWLKMIIGMIEHSRKGDPSWPELRKSIDKEEPEINQRMDVTQARMAKARQNPTWDPYTNRRQSPTRAVNRILGKSTPANGQFYGGL